MSGKAIVVIILIAILFYVAGQSIGHSISSIGGAIQNAGNALTSIATSFHTKG